MKHIIFVFLLAGCFSVRPPKSDDNYVKCEWRREKLAQELILVKEQRRRLAEAFNVSVHQTDFWRQEYADLRKDPTGYGEAQAQDRYELYQIICADEACGDDQAPLDGTKFHYEPTEEKEKKWPTI